MRLKKTAALLLAGLFATLSMTGCVGNLYADVAKVDDTDISSGLYLAIQYDAYNRAKSFLEDSDKDVLKQKVEGQNASAWIRSETEKTMREYVCVRRLCREKGITLDETGSQRVQEMGQYWTYLEQIYKENGIAFVSLERFLTMTELKRQLMLNLYDEGGDLYVPDEQLKTEYAEAYAHIRSVSVPLNSLQDGVDVRDEVLAKMDGLLQKLNDGATLESVAEKNLPEVYEILGRDFDPETAADSIYDSYLDYTPDDFETYSEDFLYRLKQQKVGEYGYYNMGSIVILYEVIPTFETDSDFQARRDTVIQSLKTDEYDAYLKNLYDQYSVSWRLGARSYFSPGKIVSGY